MRTPWLAALGAATLLGACSQAAPTAAKPAWPGPDNTGIPHGTALTAIGGLTIDKPGTVLDSKDVAGPVVITASDVVIRRSRIRAAAPWLVRIEDGVHGVVIEDSELVGLRQPGSVALGWTGFQGVRLNIHGTEDGVRMSTDSILKDSWIHDLLDCPTCHSDAIQSTGGTNLQILHNRIHWPHSQTSCLLLKPDLSPIDGVRVEGNLMDGGAYTLYAVAGPFGTATNVSFVGNRFGRTFIYGLKDFDVAPVWRQNVWDDTGEEI